MAQQSESILLKGHLDVCVTTLKQSFGAGDWHPMGVKLVKVKRQSINPEAGDTAAVYLRAFLADDEDDQLSWKRKGSTSSIFKRKRSSTSSSCSDLSPTYEVPLDGAVLNFGPVVDGEEHLKEIGLTYSGFMYRFRSNSSAAINEWRDRIRQTYDKHERSFTNCLVNTHSTDRAIGTTVSLVFHPPGRPQVLQLHQLEGESALIDHIKLSSIVKFGVKSVNQVFWMNVDRGGRFEDVEILHKDAEKIKDSMSSFIAMQGRVMEVTSQSWGTEVTERRLSIPLPGTQDSRVYYNVVGVGRTGKSEGDMTEKLSPSEDPHVLPKEENSADDEGYMPMSPVLGDDGGRWGGSVQTPHDNISPTLKLRDKLLNEIRKLREEQASLHAANTSRRDTDGERPYVNMDTIKKHPPFPSENDKTVIWV